MVIAGVARPVGAVRCVYTNYGAAMDIGGVLTTGSFNHLLNSSNIVVFLAMHSPHVADVSCDKCERARAAVPRQQLH